MFFNLHLFPLDSHLLIVSVLSLNPMSKRKGLWNITETFHSVAICFLKQLLKINPKLLNFISDLHLSKISIPSLWGFRQKKKKKQNKTQNLKPLWKKCSLTPFQNVLKFKQTDKTNPRLGLFNWANTQPYTPSHMFLPTRFTSQTILFKASLKN